MIPGDDLPLPASPADVDAAWLTAALRASGALAPTGRVVGIERGRGAGGLAATSEVARLRLTLEPPGCGPGAVFVKVPKPTPASLADHAIETWFYERVAADLPLRVPACYHAGLDAHAGRGVLVLQDLTDVRPGHPVDGCSEAEVAATLDALAAVHRATADPVAMAAVGARPLPFDADDTAARLARFRAAWPAFRRQRRYPVPDAVADRFAALDDEALVESRRLWSSAPRVLTHGDLHTENLLLERGPDDALRVWMFDWQDARLAHPVVDYANVVFRNARAEVQAAAAGRLLARYHAALGEALQAALPLGRLLEDHRGFLPWRVLSDVLFLVRYEPADEGEVAVLRAEWERMQSGFLDPP